MEQQVREGSKTLLSLDDQIGELQKQIEELTGGEQGLNKIIFVTFAIDANKDKISRQSLKTSMTRQKFRIIRTTRWR